MATIVLGLAGAAAGALIAGPAGAVKGAELGFAIGTTVGSIIDAPHVPGQDVGRVSDLHVSGSQYGAAIPQVWGRARLGGNILWATDLVPHTSTQHHGKGGGGPTTTTYTYTVSCQVLVCAAGRNARVTRIWGDDLVIWEEGGAGIVTPRFCSGSETQSADTLIAASPGSGAAAGQAPACRGQLTFVLQDFLLTNFSNRIPNFSVEVATDPVTVADVLGDLALSAGLTTGDFDFSQGTADVVTGYVLTGRQGAADAMKPLLAAYFYDLVECDGLLQCVKRGGASVRTIDAADLGAGHGKAQSTRITEKRLQDVELPFRVDVAYYNAQKHLQKASQGAVRMTATGQNAQSVSLPLALTDDEAEATAQRILYTSWIEREPVEFFLPPRYLTITPADVVTLPLTRIDGGETLARIRITSADLVLPGEIHFEAVPDDASVLHQAGTGAGSAPPINPPKLVAVPTLFYAWSGLEVQDADQAAPGFYVAATGLSGWTGATIWYSADGGSSYLPAGTVTGRSVFGLTTSALSGGGTAGAEDTGSTVGVSVNGPLTTTTYDSVTHGVNAAKVGGELLGFANASLTAAGQYTLSDLLRGGRMSPMTGHASGEPFVLLTDALARVSVDDSLVGHIVLVKCVSNFQTLSDVTPQPVLIAARTPTADEVAISTLQGDVGKVSVDGTDTPDYLEAKLTAGTGVTLTPSAGTLRIDTSGSAPTGAAGGDLAGSYPNPTLAEILTSAGSGGDSTHTLALSWDKKGRITGASLVAIAYPSSLPPSGSAGGDLTGSYPNPSLAAVVTAGTFGDASHYPIVTVDSKGRVTGVTLQSSAGAYTLPTASASVLGGIKVGAGLSIDGSGVLSATATTPADASATVKGITKLSVAPVTATSPVAVGDNDTRVTADQPATTASIRTLGTGAQQAAAGNHTHSVMGASGSGHAAGFAPDPGSTGGTTRALFEDGTWKAALQKRRLQVSFYPASTTADTAANTTQTYRLPKGTGGATIYWKLMSAVLRVETPNANPTTAQLYYSAGGNAAFGAGTNALTSALSVSGTTTYEASTTNFTGSLAVSGLVTNSILAPLFSALGGSKICLETEWEEV